MIKITVKGDLHKTNNFLTKIKERKYMDHLETYAKMGVEALKAATPKDSGLTADSWSYKINKNGKDCSIQWDNSNTANGIPIVILLEYGHVTKNGGYVLGREFITPAIQPIFDKIADEAWGEVKSL